MGMVMIRCPATGHNIPTGLEAEQSDFSTKAVFFARSYCGFCRIDHEWFAKDAWVCEPAAERRVRAA
jgi:hypothetical protein